MSRRGAHSDLVERLGRLLTGLILFGISISLMINARLGVASWDVFHQGLSDHFALSLGTACQRWRRRRRCVPIEVSIFVTFMREKLALGPTSMLRFW